MSAATEPASNAPPTASREVVPWKTVRRLIVLSLAIFVPIVGGTCGIGVLLFDGRLAFGAAFVGLFLALLISIPMCLAVLADEVLDHPDH